MSSSLAGRFFTTEPPRKPIFGVYSSLTVTPPHQSGGRKDEGFWKLGETVAGF